MPPTARLTGENLRRLSRLSDLRGALDVLAAWAVIAGAAAAAHAVGAWWAYAAAAAVVASRQAALANLAHDAWHGLCFRSRGLNDAVGAWLYSYPVGIPFFHDRRRHLKHHRTVGRPEDPDWVNYTSEGRETPGRVVRYLLGRLLGSLLVSTAWSVLIARKPRIALAEEERRPGEPAHEMLRVAAVQIALAAGMGAWLGWRSYLVLWLAPLATLTAFCNSLRAFVEHVSEDPAAPPEARLRDLDAGPLERAFFSPAHFHFHALHHAQPTIPHYLLAEAKSVLAETAGGYPYPTAPGYLILLRDHLRALGARGEAG